MAKNRALDNKTFYAFRYFDGGAARAYKLEYDAGNRTLVRVYEIENEDGKIKCNCPGSSRGTCKHEMMVRSKEMYREFSDVEKQPMDVYVQTRIRGLFEELELQYARKSQHKTGMNDALIYKGKKSNPWFHGEDKVLVLFFDPQGLGVPYVKAVVLLENFEAKTETVADEMDKVKARAQESLKGAQKAREDHRAQEAMQSMASEIAGASTSPYPTILMGGPDDLCTITLPKMEHKLQFELVQTINQLVIEFMEKHKDK